MKRKLKLRNWVKVVIGYIGACLIMVLLVNVFTNRIEQIENGSIKVIPESEMAERS